MKNKKRKLRKVEVRERRSHEKQRESDRAMWIEARFNPNIQRACYKLARNTGLGVSRTVDAAEEGELLRLVPRIRETDCGICTRRASGLATYRGPETADDGCVCGASARGRA